MPKAIYILLTPVEALQVFILRPATLVIRLLANMMAGHLLLALCFAATSYLFFETSAVRSRRFGAVTFVAGFGFLLFEVFVAALQAYVFAILTAVYLQMSISTSTDRPTPRGGLIPDRRPQRTRRAARR